MKKRSIFILLFILQFQVFAQDLMTYTLSQTDTPGKIEIIIAFDSISTNTAKLVIPRSGPGTYDLTNYMAYVDDVKGQTVSGKTLDATAGMGSFFIFNEKDEVLNAVRYEVDINQMEAGLLGGFASSKSREDYLGLLGYSVFGFMEGHQDSPINLNIKIQANWPIFSTLRPTTDRKSGNDTFKVDNFSLLADAQFLLGNGVQVLQVKDAPIPLFVAVYAQTDVNLEEIGRRGLVALNGLTDYFGYIPMPHYTLFYEYVIPLSDKHNYGFYMEHLNSMSASNDTSNAITTYDPEARIGSIVHHIGHSWLPLRSYGTGYRPFEWQTAPLIETIWLNEGFIWYVSFYDVLGYKGILNFFNTTVDSAPEYMKNKSLRELSLLGSTQYSLDFRIGRNLFSRGALMAHDLDVFIRNETNGEKSFKEAILGLLNWTAKHQRAFAYDEIEPIMSEATGVDLSAIWKEWQKPRE